MRQWRPQRFFSGKRKLVGSRSASWREARLSTLAILCSSTRVTEPGIFRWFIRWRAAQGRLLSTIAAILFFGERPSVIALAGGLMIVAGVIVLTCNPQRLSQAGARKAMAYALMTGTFIAAYTLWDKQAVSRFAVSPILLDWGANLVRSLLLTPFALRHWKKRAQRMADPPL